MRRKRRSVVVGGIAFFDEGCSADDIEGGGIAAGGLESNAEGLALPLGGLADGRYGSGLRPLAYLLLDDGAARAKLGDDGEEAAFGGCRGAAVGGVVAEPDGVGDLGVEVGQVQCSDAAGGAIDEQPGAGLPAPARARFAGKLVIQAHRTANRKAAVGDVVSVARGPLFLPAIDGKGAHLQGDGIARLVGVICRRCGPRRHIGDFANSTEGDGVYFSRWGWR
jgi:hypothetical protein